MPWVPKGKVTSRPVADPALLQEELTAPTFSALVNTKVNWELAGLSKVNGPRARFSFLSGARLLR